MNDYDETERMSYLSKNTKTQAIQRSNRQQLSLVSLLPEVYCTRVFVQRHFISTREDQLLRGSQLGRKRKDCVIGHETFRIYFL